MDPPCLPACTCVLVGRSAQQIRSRLVPQLFRVDGMSGRLPQAACAGDVSRHRTALPSGVAGGGAERGGHPLSWRYRLLQETFMPLVLGIACRRALGVACLNQSEAAYLKRRGWVS